MSTREFTVLVQCLSPEALFRAAWQDVPRIAETPEAIASVFGSYYG